MLQRKATSSRGKMGDFQRQGGWRRGRERQVGLRRQEWPSAVRTSESKQDETTVSRRRTRRGCLQPVTRCSVLGLKQKAPNKRRAPDAATWSRRRSSRPAERREDGRDAGRNYGKSRRGSSISRHDTTDSWRTGDGRRAAATKSGGTGSEVKELRDCEVEYKHKRKLYRRKVGGCKI